MRNIQAAYEKFLLIDARGNASTLVRARALYCFGWAFVLIQLLNMIGLTYSFGKFTYEHTIAIGAIFCVLTVIHCIRFYKNFTVYGLIIMSFCLSAPLLTAVYDYTGINSSLLPFVIMSPMLTGFIAGPRLAVISGILGLVVISILYSASLQDPAASAATLQTFTVQRALQSAFAIIMVSLITAAFSTNTFRAFRLMEESVERARQAESAKSQFISSISHDLHSPLETMMTLTETLQFARDEVERERLLALLHQTSESLLHDIEDVLDISEIDMGQLKLNEAVFSPRELIRSVSRKWRQEASQKGLSFNSAVEKSLSTDLIGDEMRIRQILAKLLANAISFSQSGSIFLGASVKRLENNQAIFNLVVEDTGPGIPEHIQQGIFEAFTPANDQKDDSALRPSLGLPLCNQLTRMMDGTIDLKTDERGTRFEISLPLHTADPALMANTQPNNIAG